MKQVSTLNLSFYLKRLGLVYLLLCIVTLIKAQDPGDLDLSWGNGGLVEIDFGNGFDDGLNDLVILPNGKVLAGGYSHGQFLLARFTTGGNLDTSFGNNGIVRTDITAGDDRIYALALQADGKIVLGGQVAGETFISPTTDMAVARYLANGNLDTSFGSNGVFTFNVPSVLGATTPVSDWVKALAIQPDGKIIAGGSELRDDSFFMVRLTANGELDTTFDHDGIASYAFILGGDSELYDLALQPDGKIIACGQVKLASSLAVGVKRYLANGSPDNGFGIASEIVTNVSNSEDDYATSIQLLPDGSFIVGGVLTKIYQELVLLKYTKTGELDTSFGSSGITTQFYRRGLESFDTDVNDIAVLADGSLVAVGKVYNFALSRFLLTRFTKDGTLDLDFAHDGFNSLPSTGTTGEGSKAMAIDADGKIVTVGTKNIGNYTSALVRYHTGVGVATKEVANVITDVQVFPNPFPDRFTLSYSLVDSQNLTVTLSNTVGQVVYTQHLTKRPGINAWNAPDEVVKALFPGIYLIQLRTNQQLISTKVVKL